MSPILEQALPAIGGGAIGAIATWLRGPSRKAANAKTEAEAEFTKTESAEVLARAYSILVDDLRDDLKRQERELDRMRDELTSLRTAREAENAALRSELAAERAENTQLRGRVASLESQVQALQHERGAAPTEAGAA